MGLPQHDFQLGVLQTDALDLDARQVHRQSCGAEALARFSIGQILVTMSDAVPKRRTLQHVSAENAGAGTCTVGLASMASRRRTSRASESTMSSKLSTA